MTADRFIGMISGTSRDGVDAVLAEFREDRPELLLARCVPYPEPLRRGVDAIIEANQRPVPASTAALDRNLGHLFARIAADLVRDAGLEPGDVRGIGSHGQTVWHEPAGPDPVSLQLGSGPVIAEVTGITTVSDFRSADLGAGGEGAPLAPLLHRALFARPGERRAVLNLGGIANVTVLDGEKLDGGFDTGPANCLMDAWTRRHRGARWDEGGAWAASGSVDAPLLERLLDEPYFHRSGPRSTGLEAFNESWLERRLGDDPPAPADVQRTLAELTVETVAGALERAGGADRVLVCGGGVHNGFLLGRLAERLAPATVESTARHGADPDWIEASLFAWLARERLAGRTLDTRAATGAAEPVLLGEIHRP